MHFFRATHRVPRYILVFPIDGHVHFHRRDRACSVLDAAAGSFLGLPRGEHRGLLGALLLTQTPREDVFEWLRDQHRVCHWSIQSVPSEPESLLAVSKDHTLLLVCGRQIRVAHGVEWLALGTTSRFIEDKSLEDTLDDIVTAGALPVLPWGFGKWWGKRGQQVRALLARHESHDFFLGDNGGRLKYGPDPELFVTGHAAGYRLLPGSDPFPFGGGYRHAGTYGFYLESAPGLDTPWRDISARLRSMSSSPPPFGVRTGLARFMFNQVWMQVRGRLLKPA
jgi:hypothetical protein